MMALEWIVFNKPPNDLTKVQNVRAVSKRKFTFNLLNSFWAEAGSLSPFEFKFGSLKAK